MRSVQSSGAIGAPPPTIVIQSGAIRRRVAASDSLALLLAGLAYGEPRRSDLGMLSSVTASRVADTMGVPV